MQSITLEAYCTNHTGYRRRNNEDNFYFFNQILKQEHLGLSHPVGITATLHTSVCLAVFDGMGGEENGEVASFEAAGILKECLEKESDNEQQMLKEVVQKMNQRVSGLAMQQNVRMGTTAVLLYLDGSQGMICNVGDSRGYRFREKQLDQITEDHTDALFLKSHGVVNRKPALSQYIGVPEDEFVIEPFIQEINLKKEDVYLLCSDGLTDMVSDEVIQSILSGEDCSLKEAVQRLQDTALENGGKDNITIIAVRIL